MKKIFRQGDVLIISSNVKIKTANKIDRDKGNIVLAYGEVTGHSHAIKSNDADLFEIVSDQKAQEIGKELLKDRLLKVQKEVSLVHEEHGTIKIPSGNWIVRIQKEYSPQEVRNVSD